MVEAHRGASAAASIALIQAGAAPAGALGGDYNRACGGGRRQAAPQCSSKWVGDRAVSLMNKTWTLARLEMLEKSNPAATLKEKFLWKRLATDMAELKSIELDQELRTIATCDRRYDFFEEEG